MSVKPNAFYTPGAIQGFASSRDPKCLPQGTLALLRNARISDGLVRSRWADYRLSMGLPGVFRGVFEATLNGERSLFRAEYEDGRTSVWQSRDDGASWINLTAASGPAGDTRFQGDATTPIRFCVVRDRAPFDWSESDLVIVQDGISEALVLGAAATTSTAYTLPGSSGVQKAYQPLQPPEDMVCYPALPLLRYFTVRDPASHVFPAPDPGISLADQGPNQWIVLTVDPANYSVGNRAQVVFASPVDFSESKMAIAIVGQNVDLFWQHIQIVISDGTNETTISDGAFFEDANGGFNKESYQVALPFLGGNGLTDLTSITTISFSYDGDLTLLSGVTSGNLFMFGAGGSTPGTSSYAMAVGSSDARTVGPARFITKGINVSIDRFGGTLQSSLGSSALFLKDSAEFDFNYILISTSTSGLIDSSDISHGIDTAYYYVKHPGQADYYLVDHGRVAAWSGSAWVGIPISREINEAIVVQDLTRRADPDGVVIPIGTAMVTANGRLFVGAGARLWFSNADQPWQFVKAVRFLPDGSADGYSGGSMSFDGQTLQALIPVGSFAGAAEDLSTPIAGATTIHVLTDRGMYQLSGFDASSLSKPIPIAPYGTLSPMSVGRSRLGFYWLGDDGQVCWYSSTGLSRPSLDLVDDMTIPIPHDRKAWVWGACAKDRYYLAFSSGGETNDRILVWDERGDRWESVDTVNDSAEALIPFYSDSEVRLFRFSTDAVYEHEKFGCTANVDLNMTFGEQVAPMMRVVMNSMTIWADGSSTPYQLLCRRRDPSTNTHVDGYCRFPDSQRSVRVEEPGKGMVADSIQPSITGSVPGGTRIHGVWANVDTAPWGAKPSV